MPGCTVPPPLWCLRKSAAYHVTQKPQTCCTEDFPVLGNFKAKVLPLIDCYKATGGFFQKKKNKAEWILSKWKTYQAYNQLLTFLSTRFSRKYKLEYIAQGSV